MMNQIIRAENYRIRKNKTFRIACIVIIGMVLVGFALFYAATHMISGELMEAAGGYDTDVDAFTDINLFECRNRCFTDADSLYFVCNCDHDHDRGRETEWCLFADAGTRVSDTSDLYG